MIWILFITAVVLGYYSLKVWAVKDEQKKTEWVENTLSDYKSIIYSYHDDRIAEYSGGKRLIGSTRNETDEKIIEWRTEIEKIRLWDKHYKTIMASDTFSADSKSQLYSAWFDYLLAYSSMLQGMIVGVGDPWEEIKNVLELMDTFLAKLEAFGYDGEKEQDAIKDKLVSQSKKTKRTKR